MLHSVQGMARANEPRKGHGSALAILVSVRRHARLVWEMSKRDLSDLHAGQAAGKLWLILHPLLILLVYSVLFTVVFKVRIGSNSPSDYVVYLLAGLAPWLLTQDAFVRATGCIVASGNIIKKVMFPPEVIVAKTVITSLLVQGVLMALALGFIVFVRGGLAPSWLLLPVLGLMHLALIWGLSLFLAALTPYFRDVTEFVRVFLTINIYLMPVTYTPSMVPDILRVLLYVNPFSHLVWCYQDLLYYNTLAHPWSWLVLLGLSAVCMMAGSTLFYRLRSQFSSVL